MIAATRAACVAMLAVSALHAPGRADEPPAAALREWLRTFVKVPERPWRVQAFETTQEIFLAVMAEEPSQWKGVAHSVEMVSWEEAAQFCQRATALLRAAKAIGPTARLRLPTVAEWQHFCRAGTVTAYSFGDDPAKLTDYAWFDANAAGNDPPVGQKASNPWGLYDVHGYLWEWCADESPDGRRPVAGGAWTSSAAECRSDSTQLLSADTRRPDVGFRCVLED